MSVAPSERTTAGLGCSPGREPTVRVADPEAAGPAHPERGMPRVRQKRGGVFRPSILVVVLANLGMYHQNGCAGSFTAIFLRMAELAAVQPHPPV